MKQTLSIVIPVYNEEKTLVEVVTKVLNTPLPDHLKREIIIVNDGSSDSTPEIIQQIELENREIVKVHHSPVNLGKGAAVRFGLRLCTGDFILIQDADLELNPEDYPKLLSPILSGESDVVYGSRFSNKSNRVPWKGRMANKFFAALTNLLYGANLTDIATAYKLFRKTVLNDLHLTATRFEIEPEITAKILLKGIAIKEVPISYQPRTVEQGKKIGWIDGVKYILTLLKYRFGTKR